MTYRTFAVSGVGVAAVLVGTLLFGNLNDNLVYYLTPREAVAKRADFADGQRFRLGGLVVKGSVVRAPGSVRFTVRGGGSGARVAVVHRGAPSQLFRAGIGVVLEGRWRGATFVSDTMIVKHDQEYRPPAAGAQGGRR